MKAKKIKNKKSNDPEVLVYCKACLNIRNGTYLSEENYLIIVWLIGLCSYLQKDRKRD